jgi:hypothetical protein
MGSFDDFMRRKNGKPRASGEAMRSLELMLDAVLSLAYTELTTHKLTIQRNKEEIQPTDEDIDDAVDKFDKAYSKWLGDYRNYRGQ